MIYSDSNVIIAFIMTTPNSPGSGEQPKDIGPKHEGFKENVFDRIDETLALARSLDKTKIENNYGMISEELVVHLGPEIKATVVSYDRNGRLPKDGHTKMLIVQYDVAPPATQTAGIPGTAERFDLYDDMPGLISHYVTEPEYDLHYELASARNTVHDFRVPLTAEHTQKMDQYIGAIQARLARQQFIPKIIFEL